MLKGYFFHPFPAIAMPQFGLHSETLALSVCLIAPLLAVGNLIVWRQTRERAMLWWAFGNLTLAVAIGISLVHPAALAAALVLIALAIGFDWLGIRCFQGQAGSNAPTLLLTAVGASSVLGLALAGPSGNPGYAVLTTAIAGLSAASAFELISRHGNLGKSASRFVGGLFSINAVFFLLLGVQFAHTDSASETLRLALYGETLALVVGWNFGVVMMAMQRYLDLVIDLATHDDLTGVLNRRAFGDRARHHLELAARGGPVLSLLAIDLDHFKRVNDTHGHQAGDRVLREVVGIVQSCLRSPDLLARIGGEEFVVLLPVTRTAGALALAERLRQAVAAMTIDYRGTPLQATISIGVAEFEAQLGDLDGLLAAADAALYRAKSHGRNRVELAAHESALPPPVQLAWDGRYLSGHATIDAEHRYLIDMINKLVGMAQTEADVRNLHRDLEEMLFWLSEHFRHEEATFLPTGWRGASEHMARHRDLEARGRELLAGIVSGEHAFAELLDFLIREVVGIHLAQCDVEFFPAVAGASPHS